MSPTNTIISFCTTHQIEQLVPKTFFFSSSFPEWGAYIVRTFNKALSKTIFSISTLSLCLFDINNTVHQFFCYKYSYTVRSLFTSHPEQLISFAFSSKKPATTASPLCILNASINSPAIHVSETTLQVPTQNPFHSLLVLRSSWTQLSALAQGSAAFWLVFPHPVCVGMWGHTGWYPTIIFLHATPSSPTIFMPDALPGATSYFILAWDRHRVCWLAYRVAWFAYPVELPVSKIVQHTTKSPTNRDYTHKIVSKWACIPPQMPLKFHRIQSTVSLHVPWSNILQTESTSYTSKPVWNNGKCKDTHQQIEAHRQEHCYQRSVIVSGSCFGPVQQVMLDHQPVRHCSIAGLHCDSNKRVKPRPKCWHLSRGMT